MNVVYFSSSSESVHRFCQQLDTTTIRLPANGQIQVAEPFVLITPTYCAGGAKGAVPKAVIHFLNNATNRALLRGVIASGNSNFGRAFCLAGEVISQKCNVPYLYRFELMGLPEDVAAVNSILKEPNVHHS